MAGTLTTPIRALNTPIFTMSDPNSVEALEQLRVKDSRAVRASELRDHLLGSSMASLADSIGEGPGSVVIFNVLNWKRSGVISIDLDTLLSG